jgi:RNA-directed DNA polymerase
MVWNEEENCLIVMPWEADKLFSNRQLPEIQSYCQALVEKDLPPLIDVQSLAAYSWAEDSRIIRTDEAFVKRLHLLQKMSNHPERWYTSATIPKRDGSQRHLSIPQIPMKQVQRWINRHILSKVTPSPYATAFSKGMSVVENVRPHVGNPLLVKMDMKSFFSRIPFKRVFGVFARMGFNSAVCTQLSNLCCCEGVLPQGAPTSPALSNLVLAQMDRRIAGFCHRRGITYTRYADDMSFSGDFQASELLWFLRRVLPENGFEANEKKTRILGRGQKHRITGVVANAKPQTDKEYRRQVRQEIYYLKKYGLHDHLQRYKADRKVRISRKKYLQKLLGRIAHVLSINQADETFRRYKEEVIEIYNAAWF